MLSKGFVHCAVLVKLTNLQPFFIKILQKKITLANLISIFARLEKEASEMTYVGRPTDFQSTSSIHQLFLNRLHNHTSNPFWTIVFFTLPKNICGLCRIFLDFFFCSTCVRNSICGLPWQEQMWATVRKKYASDF